MKNAFLFILLVVSIITCHGEIDFSATSPSGHTLYYSVISGTHNVEVAYPGNLAPKPTGNLIIPASVVDNGITYSVTRIGRSAFYQSSELTSAVIPNTVTSIGEYAFEYCSRLSRVVLSNSLVEIEVGVFIGCTSLPDITLPNSLETIGNQAFAGCNRLSSLIIPSAVTRIGSSAFSNCSNIAEITALPQNAPLSFGANPFPGVNEQIPVYIPCGSLSSYMREWSHFYNLIEPEAFSLDVTSNDINLGWVTILTEPTCAAPQAVAWAVPAPGYRFDYWSNGVSNNPYYLTLTSDTAFVAIFARESGIEEVSATYVVECFEGTVRVIGAEGQTIRFFDAQGRQLMSETAVDGKTYSLPHSGIYLLQVGKDPARKVVVIK